MYNATYKSNWWGFIGKRVLIALLVLLVALSSIILLVQSNAQLPDGDYMSTGTFDSALHELGLDTPLITRYYKYLTGFFIGDWGYPYWNYPWLIDSK
jgi:ABC-type dipeptide/oligopeptide/nickel transport system permease component